ncbi:MAG TPA: TonB-dependent receptor [Longimicrobiales bacterium]|nr:TonB-dependent receptor [Longimicrobiales bacterium]
MRVLSVGAAAMVLVLMPVQGGAAALAQEPDTVAGARAGGAGAGEAAAGVVLGRVVSAGAAVPYARVEVRGTAAATTADSAGAFVIRLRPGRYTLLASGLGYGVAEVAVVVASGGATRVELEVRASALSLSPIVVTGTLRETHVSESAVKVDVVSGRYLERSATSNLMEAIAHVNGLYRQVDCGVCYTDNIRINGMEGPYTAVLIDGMPIMSALASVYGLNGINPSLIDRLEIVKGPASTLYGTEAMGGVVNVITKDSRFAPPFVVDARRASSGGWTVDAAGAPSSGDVSTLVSGTLVHSDRFLDDNADGFSDAPLETRGALFARADWAPAGRKLLSVTGKLYREDRFGGVEAWTEADRGSGEVYGEWILTDRAELLASAHPTDGLRADVSWTRHHQDSWYGTQRFEARQEVAYGTVNWSGAVTQRHGLLLGASLRHERYDDDTPATPAPERRTIPGVFGQHEYAPVPELSILWGARLDHHASHGLIAAPRLSLKWQAADHTALRFNGGTGFRVVNLFTEDHAALTGAREVVIAEALHPERSVSGALNLNHTFLFDSGEAMVDVDAFYTVFANRIIPDYDTDPDLIIYENLRGQAVSRGVSVAVNHVVFDPSLSYDLGLTLQDVHIRDDAGRRDQLFSPVYTAVASGSWAATSALTLDYTARLIGPMRLPRYDPPFTRPTRSPAHMVHNVQAALDVGRGAVIYGGVRNLFDFTQGSPLVDPGNPFGDAFDTTYVWGPIRGRDLMLGARWGVSR